MDSFDEHEQTWRRLFRQRMWLATARLDAAAQRWLLRAVDHSGLTFEGDAPGSLTAEEALDRAELLAP